MATTPQEAIRDADKHVSFLDDHYETVDTQDFWLHSQNVARVVEPTQALAKLFVLPLEPRGSDNRHFNLRFFLIGSHQIWDGLTTFVWLRDLVHNLNKSEDALKAQLATLLDKKTLPDRLPLPQEALYPPISGSRFANPLLRRSAALLGPVAPPSPTYAAVLCYSKTPPLSSAPVFAKVSPRNTQRLHRLCREAKASIGAGCFALAALVMMEIHEALTPGIPLSERKPFVSLYGAFFSHHNDPDSLMLAFSDGIALPFLSAELDLDGRIRLLARQAHRQLASYQKRSQPAEKAAELQYMSSRGAGRVLANQYISSVERSNALLPEQLRKNINPQGEYPMRPNMTTQTCGVSSVGRRDAFIKQGMYDLNDNAKDLVADFRDTAASVRPREGEFLVGIGSTDDGLGVSVSVDGSSMDPALVSQWKDRLEHVLDEDNKAEKARL
ncbi:hypothetical protein LTR85_008551 [Meristemomyces frigidus]|nr:hypothetical protein LTR85_008551 [Meristemomyces frigidus]